MHIERAGADALDLLAGSLGISSMTALQEYDTETITAVFPEYFKDIKPKIVEIRQNIAARRTERKINGDEPFLDYLNKIEELTDITKTVNRMIPSLQEYSNRREREKVEIEARQKKENRTDNWWKIFIALISVTAGYLLSKIK